MNSIPMPPRNSISEVVARAASKCLFLACKKQFPLIPIGKAATVVSGGTPSTRNPNYWEGDTVWVTPKDLGKPRNLEINDSERKITQEGLDRSSARLLPIGTILLSSRAPIGHLGITAVPLATNQGFKNIICNDEQLYNRFLFHMLRANIEELQAQGRGNTFTEIPARTVKEFEIAFPPLNIQKAVASFLDTLYWRLYGKQIEFPYLPECISEQQRIVAKIEQLAAKVEEACSIKAQAELNINALASACSAKFFETDKVKWPFLKLQDITERITKGESPSWQGFAYQEFGPIFVRSQNVLWGKFDLQDVEHISIDFHAKLLRSQLRPNDVLINLVGASIGRTCVVPNSINEANINQAVAVITPQKDELDSSYLMRFLLSPTTQEIIHGGKVETARPNISLRDLARLHIPLPPLEEQCRIVAYLDNLQAKVDSLKHHQTQTQTELDALLPSILDKAFRGEL